MELLIKDDVRIQEFRSEKINLKLLITSRLSVCLHFLIFCQSNLKSLRQKKYIADL